MQRLGRNMWRFPAGLLIGFVACAAHAQCVVKSAPQRVQLIELYTSEGCSSCPPADRWLSALAPHPQRIAVAFHVDYWNDLGWPDRFSDARFSDRQHDIAAKQLRKAVYTPEVHVDGRDFRRWASGAPEPAGLTEVALSLRALRVNPTRLDVRLETSAAPDRDRRVVFVVSENGLTSEIRDGENAGKTLHHDHVVRAYQTMKISRMATTSLKLPADLHDEHARVVAWIEDGATGTVRNAITTALSACGPN